MNLTEHFTLEELIATSHRNIDNTPPPETVDKLRATARGLEHVRLVLGVPVLINSGYRCPALNDLVGGSANSQHMRGEAADFVAPAYGLPIAVCRAIEAADIRFDQLIWEGSWTHISFVEDRKPRRSVLTWIRGVGYENGLPQS